MSRTSCQLEGLGLQKGGYFWPWHSVRPLQIPAETKSGTGGGAYRQPISAPRCPTFLSLFLEALTERSGELGGLLPN